MESAAPQSIAPAVQNMPSQGSSTTVFKASPAHNSFPNGSSKGPASVKSMEVKAAEKDTKHNQPTTSNAVPINSAKPVNNEGPLKPLPARRRSRSKPKRHQHNMPEGPIDNKVEVSGYPVYAKPQDLYKVFCKYGPVRVEHVGRRFAVLAFDTAEAAAAARADSGSVCLYSHLLAVRPFAGAIDDQKRQVYKSKHTVEMVPPSSIPLEGSFGEQLAALLAAVRLSQEQVTQLAALYADLERVLQPVWPGCQAMPFGSITTGLGVQSSDADCFMNIPPQFRHGSHNFVNKAKRVLQQYPELFAEVFAIPRANTPIVKLFHLRTRTHCDLTFKTPLGALNSRLVAALLHADPRLPPLAVAVKYWAGARALAGSGRLSNYALTLLLLAYLQARAVLPAVHRLQAPAPPALVDCWNAAFLDRPHLYPRADAAPVQDLLGGFFQYYAAFDFETQVVCPFLGRPVPKAQFEAGGLPPEFALYERNVAAGLVAPLRTRAPVCVQDPFEQCHNVAAAVTARMADDLRAHFRFAADRYERDRENDCRNLLRAILLEGPKPTRPKSTPEYRIAVPARTLAAIAGEDWRGAVRRALFTVFERMLRMELAAAGEPETGKRGRACERYGTTLSRAVWRRRGRPPPPAPPAPAPAPPLAEWHARVTDDTPPAEWRVQLQVALSLGVEPRGAWVSLRHAAGDADAFCAFGRFLLGALPGWLAAVLRDAGECRPPEPPPRTRASDDSLEGRPEEALRETPEKVPMESPEEEPIESAEEAPMESAEEAPMESTEEAPMESAEEAPMESTEEAPMESTEEAPMESAEEAPVESHEEAPMESREEAPMESREEAPMVTREEAPMESTEEAPMELPKKASREEPYAPTEKAIPSDC